MKAFCSYYLIPSSGHSDLVGLIQSRIFYERALAFCQMGKRTDDHYITSLGTASGTASLIYILAENKLQKFR